jgi:hypothetical protein
VGGAGVKKLRPFYESAQLAEIYAHPYDHTKWREHVERVRVTMEIAQRVIDTHGLRSVVDLSCGDGAVAGGLRLPFGGTIEMSDFTTNGVPIEQSVLKIPAVDLFLCNETVEHLEAPWTVLEHIARVTKFLVLSCPLDEDPAIGNYEHYWSFTQEDIASLLIQSGFVDTAGTELTQDGWTYTYQIWTARSTYNA